MASIRTRKESGCLFFDFRYRGERCRELTMLPDTSANRKRLEKVLVSIEADIANNTFNYRRYFPSSRNAGKFDQARSSDAASHLATSVQSVEVPIFGAANTDRFISHTPLFSEFAETWYSEKEIEWRRSHKQRVRDDLTKVLIPQFGEKSVGQITKADILAFRAALAKRPAQRKATPLSSSRINRILNPLRQIINEAADRYEFLTPFQSFKQLKVKKSDVDPFTLEEVKSIISNVRADYRQYFIVRFFTGLRTGEVHGLQWKYIDFENRLILVRETFVLGEDEYTKTDSSQRDIQMSQVVFEALKEQQQITGGMKYVFCNRKGEPFDNKNLISRVWNPILRYLGLKVRRPYQCRHTAATLWLASGEAPEWIARQLGHSTTEMLFRVYSRYVPNLTRRDGSAFERLLLQSGTTRVTGGFGNQEVAANDEDMGVDHA